MGSIKSDPEILGGRPILSGYRLSVEQILHEICEDGLEEFCENFSIRRESIEDMINEINFIINKYYIGNNNE